MTEETKSAQKLKVFVSYSRIDVQFAEQLVLALQERGFESLIDRHDIDAGEEWKPRLYDLIFRCDTVVFVLSERSAVSPTCAWEVNKAKDLGKRMITVVPEPLGGVTPPPQLSDLNYIYFYPEPTVPGSGFYDGVIKLDGALRVDFAWIRAATHYSELATAWIAKGRGEDRLLRGAALTEAQDWEARTPTDSEVPHDTLDFLVASAEAEKAEAERKAKTDRTIRGAKSSRRKVIAYAALIMTVVTVLASWIAVESIGWHTIRIWGLGKLGLYDGPEMIEIRPGDPEKKFPAVFKMGSKEERRDEQPAHPVQFAKPFAIGRYEVTFDEYNDYILYKGLDQPDDENWGRGDRPVINVSWDEAKKYIRWLNTVTDKTFRLPTEAEWDYAARAGTTTIYWWGDDIGKNRANCDGCGSKWDNKKTAPVGSFPANQFGLFDTAGNVWEWLEDCWDTATVDGICDPRVIRGGSWYVLPVYLRSAYRSRGGRSLTNFNLGFRLAQDLSN